MTSEQRKSKIKTLMVIETEMKRRLDVMRKSNINVMIAITNEDTASLGAIASIYAKSIEENMRMLGTMEKILKELDSD